MSNRPQQGVSGTSSIIDEAYAKFCSQYISLEGASPINKQSSGKLSAEDIRNIERLEQLLNLLREDPVSGERVFRNLYPGLHPLQREGWSGSRFEEIGLHSDLSNPRYHGSSTVRGIFYLDLDNTQTNLSMWTPRSALDHASFVIQLAQRGIVVVPVTGSFMHDGDPNTEVNARLDKGEFFRTPLIVTNGGAKGYRLVGSHYESFDPYAAEVDHLIEAWKGKWTALHDRLLTIAKEAVDDILGTKWVRNAALVNEFNQTTVDELGRTACRVDEIPIAITQYHTPLDNADSTGRVNFFITLPSDDSGGAEDVVARIHRRFSGYLREEGISDVTAFPFFEHTFGNRAGLIQFGYDVGVIGKHLAVLISKHIREAIGLPLDVFSKHSFGGDGLNDSTFIAEWSSQATSLGVGMQPQRGIFIVCPGREQAALRDAIVGMGWPREKIASISPDDGELWCERLRTVL